jgi:hypothetical protein
MIQIMLLECAYTTKETHIRVCSFLEQPKFLKILFASVNGIPKPAALMILIDYNESRPLSSKTTFTFRASASKEFQINSISASAKLIFPSLLIRSSCIVNWTELA